MDSSQFLELAVSLSAQAAIVVVVAHWLGRLVGNERAQCRLWTACYVLLLALVAAGTLLPHPRLFQPFAGVDGQTAVTLVSLEADAGELLFLTWLVGVAISLVLFGVRLVRTNLFLKSCQPIDPAVLASADIYDDLQKLSTNSPQRSIRLLTSSRLTTPFCWQFHRPYIVLPAFLLECNRPDLRFIIRHEVEHLRTGHPLQLFLQRVIEIVFWFHPMIWWASQQSALVREFACDEAAVESPADIANYLRALLTIVEHAAAQNSNAPTSLAFGREQSTVAIRARRLVRIARGHQARVASRLPAAATMTSLVAASVLIGLLWLPVNAVGTPRSTWSPWPSWSSRVLHDVGFRARDFEVYNYRFKLHELLEADRPGSRSSHRTQ